MFLLLLAFPSKKFRDDPSPLLFCTIDVEYVLWGTYVSWCIEVWYILEGVGSLSKSKRDDPPVFEGGAFLGSLSSISKRLLGWSFRGWGLSASGSGMLIKSPVLAAKPSFSLFVKDTITSWWMTVFSSFGFLARSSSASSSTYSFAFAVSFNLLTKSSGFLR